MTKRNADEVIFPEVNYTMTFKIEIEFTVAIAVETDFRQLS